MPWPAISTAWSRRLKSSASISSGTKCWRDEAPRDLSGPELAKALKKLGYVVTRQHGSHLRLTTQEGGEHHEVVPNHSPIKLGTLKGILRNVAQHHGKSVAELMEMLEL